MKQLFLIFSIIFSIQSCQKDKFTPSEPPPPRETLCDLTGSWYLIVGSQIDSTNYFIVTNEIGVDSFYYTSFCNNIMYGIGTDILFVDNITSHITNNYSKLYTENSICSHNIFNVITCGLIKSEQDSTLIYQKF